MKSMQNKGYTGNEILMKELSKALNREITRQELNAALAILTDSVVTEMQENNKKETRINKLMQLRLFKYMFSTDSDLRMKTKDEVLSVYSATPGMIDSIKANTLMSLIEILNVDKNKIQTQELINGINMRTR